MTFYSQICPWSVPVCPSSVRVMRRYARPGRE